MTIYDREEDQRVLYEIMDHYKMRDRLNKLESPEHLKKILESLSEEGAV